MSYLESGMTVLSKEHGEGKIISMAKKDNGYRTYLIKWPSGLLRHPAHEAENFFHAEAIRCFPPRESVVQ